MERIPSSPPAIAPLPETPNRPLWSVMIPVYNCAQFIPEVLERVLMQDLGEAHMQIEVIDDASTDEDIEALVQHIGKGRVKYYRHPKNVGSLRNFETCINRSKGRLVHLLHGDDRVRAGFYDKMENLFNAYPNAGAASCRYTYIDESGNRTHDQFSQAEEDGLLADWFLRIAEVQRIQYVSTVVRREVYESLGSFYGVTYGEDWEMWVRIARCYPVAYTPEILAEYRVHDNSISTQMERTGRSFEDLLQTRAFVEDHIRQENLPLRLKEKVIHKGKQHCALQSMTIANRVWRHTQNTSEALKHIKTALTLSKTPLIYYHISKFYLKTFFKIY